MFKKLFTAVALAVWTAGIALGAQGNLVDVWGVKFSSNFETANTQMQQNGMQLLYDAIVNEVDRVVVYQGSFYSRECAVELRFGSSGLYEFQFWFKRPPEAASEDRGAQLRQRMYGGNYNQLLRSLTGKYGDPNETLKPRQGEGKVWNFDNGKIVLNADSRSASSHTTVLTYRLKHWNN